MQVPNAADCKYGYVLHCAQDMFLDHQGTKTGHIFSQRRFIEWLRIELWPFSRPTALYQGLFRDLGRVDACENIIVLCTSAHPSPWLAGRACGREMHVLQDRPSSHSIAHAREIAMATWRAEYLTKNATAGSKNKRKLVDSLQARCVHFPAFTLQNLLF